MSLVPNPSEPTSNQPWIASAGLLFGAACWGVVWYPYRILQEAGIGGVAASLYTYAIALVFGGLLFARSLSKGWRIPAGIGWLALAAGWTNLSYVLAVIDGEVMRVMLLFYLSPLWTLMLAHFWLRERTNLAGLAVIGVSLTGAGIMLWQPGEWPLPKDIAEWLGLSSGVGFAFTNVITRRSAHLSVAAKSTAVWIGVLGMSLLFMPFQASLPPHPLNLTGGEWGIMGIIAFLLVSATVCVQYGLTHVAVTRASVLFLFELVVAAVASYYWAGEAMAWHEWIGGTLIIAAAVFAARRGI